VLHEANTVLAKVVGGSSKGKALLYVMETYTKILSYSQEALYFLNQAGRKPVIQSIAWGVDPKIQYLSWAELMNATSLNSRIKWDKTNSSNNFDEDKSLRLTTERSLNELSRGESFRDLGSTLLGPVNTVLKPFDFICSLIGVGLSISVGPEGFDVSDFDEVSGDVGKPGKCESGCDEDHIVQNDKLYQHDFAGITFKACVTTVRLGHHSDDAWNVGGSKAFQLKNISIAPPHIVDDVLGPENGQHDLAGIRNFEDNGIQCTSIGVSLDNPSKANDKCDNVGKPCGFNGIDQILFSQKVKTGQLSPAQAQQACADQLAKDNNCTCPDFSKELGDANACGLNFSASCGSTLQNECGLPASKIQQYESAVAEAKDQGQPQPDLSSQISSDCQGQLLEDKCTSNDKGDNGETLDCKLPKNVGGTLGAANQCGQIASGGAAKPPPGLDSSGKKVGSGTGPCQTIYQFDTKLPDVKVTTFIRDSDIDPSLDGRRIQGPTIFVYFQKQAQFLPLFSGLHYPAPPTIGAYSFAKVYYTRKPGDTSKSPGSPKKRIEGKETIFNPFWAARLELPRPFGGTALLH
jgi:hypothetical protein